MFEQHELEDVGADSPGRERADQHARVKKDLHDRARKTSSSLGFGKWQGLLAKFTKARHGDLAAKRFSGDFTLRPTGALGEPVERLFELHIEANGQCRHLRPHGRLYDVVAQADDGGANRSISRMPVSQRRLAMMPVSCRFASGSSAGFVVCDALKLAVPQLCLGPAGLAAGKRCK
jgi:hypothetical protein